MNHSSNLKSLFQRLVYFFLLQILIPSNLTLAEDNITTFIQSCVSIPLASLQVKICLNDDAIWVCHCGSAAAQCRSRV